ESYVPSIFKVSVRVLQFLPQGGTFRLDAADKLLRLLRQPEFRVHSGQHENVNLCFTQFWPLLIHRPVGAQKDEDVERDDSNGDNGPPASLHVLVVQRDQHALVTPRKLKRKNSAPCN